MALELLSVEAELDGVEFTEPDGEEQLVWS